MQETPRTRQPRKTTTPRPPALFITLTNWGGNLLAREKLQVSITTGLVRLLLPNPLRVGKAYPTDIASRRPRDVTQASVRARSSRQAFRCGPMPFQASSPENAVIIPSGIWFQFRIDTMQSRAYKLPQNQEKGSSRVLNKSRSSLCHVSAPPPRQTSWASPCFTA